jgi:hypothetical protein
MGVNDLVASDLDIDEKKQSSRSSTPPTGEERDSITSRTMGVGLTSERSIISSQSKKFSFWLLISQRGTSSTIALASAPL